MAVKSIATIKAEIAALTPLVTLTEIQGILTDICDSSGVGSNIYTCPLTSDLVAGDNTRTHNLYINIFNVFVIDGSEVYKPDFEIIDDQNTLIKWVGTTLSSPAVYYLSTT